MREPRTRREKGNRPPPPNRPADAPPGKDGRRGAGRHLARPPQRPQVEREMTARPPRPSDTATPSTDAARGLILCSDMLSAKLYRVVLREAGLRSVVVPDSAVIEGALQEGVPALIIVDPVRWTASLIDTLAGLRARPELRSVRLIALINHGIGPERADALAPVCDGVLSKPISIAGFLETIGRLVPDRRA